MCPVLGTAYCKMAAVLRGRLVRLSQTQSLFFKGPVCSCISVGRGCRRQAGNVLGASLRCEEAWCVCEPLFFPLLLKGWAVHVAWRPLPDEHVPAWVKDFKTGEKLEFVQLRKIIWGLPIRRDILQR